VANTYSTRDERLKPEQSLPVATSIMIFAQGGYDGVLWSGLPITLFLLSSSEESVGALMSLFNLAGALFMMAHHLLHPEKPYRTIVLSISCLLAGAMMLAIVPGHSLVAFSSFYSAAALFLSIIPVLLFARMTDETRDDPAGIIVGRELFLNLGRITGRGSGPSRST